MKYEIEIIEEAENDVFEIIKWYNEQQENLGFEFYEVLLMMYDEICVQPLHLEKQRHFIFHIIFSLELMAIKLLLLAFFIKKESHHFGEKD